MNNYGNILNKLNAFTAKFYTKMLLKGMLLFLAIGFVFFLIVLGVEYFLWLNSAGRLVLFLSFILIEVVLAIKFILVPLIFLFKLKRGLSYKEASLLIGKHFTEIDDKLYNLLDLAENESKSELLMASIEQRSENLNNVPFTKAIDLRDNLKYIKFLSIPVVLVGGIWMFGDLVNFMGSYKRMVNYDLAYEPPAPFTFRLLTPDLEVLDSEPFTLAVSTEGKVRPLGITLIMGDKEVLLQEKDGIHSYLLTPPIAETKFHFSANGIDSRSYRLHVLSTPRIQDFELELTYPPYTKKRAETIKSTGNVTVPEGTGIKWKISATNTTEVLLTAKDSCLLFTGKEGYFSQELKVFTPMDYIISTSNKDVKTYEKLAYSISIIKDAYPTLKVDQILDSVNPNISYYKGEATDDYGLSRISLIYYETGNETESQALELSRSEQNYDTFYYTFPSGLDLLAGKDYSFYFEAVDNDGIYKHKTTKSRVFNTRFLSDNELNNRNIDSKKPILNKLDKSLGMFREQQKTLQQISRQQKEKQSLSFHEQTKLKDFLQKQEQQEALMQRFQKELKENLQNGQEDDKQNILLQERLERQEIAAKKNEQLLEELNQLADKINKEELARQLEELGKRQKNSQRNLEQLLELTKRYYIQEKANQLASKLENLGKEQEELSKLPIENEISKKQQEELNHKFLEISKELKEFQEDNLSLKKPMEFLIDKEKENRITENQKEAVEAIDKHEEAGEDPSKEKGRKESDAQAKSKQRSAAKLIKEMGQNLGASIASNESSSTSEDAAVLRQLLDNLITFSFKQERIYGDLRKVNIDAALNGNIVKSQQELRDLFTHVDDGLFALSLRQAEISEFVNEQITEVYYNVDKTLESLAETQYYQGASYQKYTLTAANSLADFLANILDNMQEQMQMGSGSGEGGDFQLPDIILGQKELQQKMEQQGQGKENTGTSGEDGKPESSGKNEKGNGENGSQPEQNNPSATGMGEAELKEIYDIYKEQQKLRDQLERQLRNMLDQEERKLGEKLIRQMEEFQNELLENGITQETINKMNTINYELLKLEHAAVEQGEREARKGTTATEHFQNPLLTVPEVFQNYENEVDILNRQALPLRESFKGRVREYFKNHD